jgi:hypothetical protein
VPEPVEHRGLLTAMRRDPAAWALFLALGVLLALLFSHRDRITSDGVDHYVFLRSLAVDHDLDLANDYKVVSPRGAPSEPPTPIGRTGNAHPIGPAILWAPFYLLADILVRLRGGTPDGWNRLYLDAVAVGSVLYGWAGLVFVYLTTRAEGRGPALCAALGLAFGTFLYWYLAFAPTMAHAVSFGAAAFFVWLWLRPDLKGTRRALWLGAAAGLCALTRWSSALIVLLPVVEALPRLRRRDEWGNLAREAAAGAAAFLVVFSPQMVVWARLYGSPITIPQGTRFVSGNPAWDGVLFSPHHGLFSWSPLLYVGALGLALYALRDRWRGLAAIVFLLALTRTNAGVGDWWGGAAFGGRRFDAALPLFGLGLAIAVAKAAEVARRRPLLFPVLGVLALVGWNLAIAAQYRSGAWDYSDPVTFEEMGRGTVSLVDRLIGSPFSLPGALLERWRTGRPLADYESLYMERRYARWGVRMGWDDRMFLEDGWSAPESAAGVSWRRVAGDTAGLVVPLHRPIASVFGARVRARAPVRCRLVVNDAVLGSCEVGTEWSDCTYDVPAACLRRGRNFVRLRRMGEGDLEVAAAWLEPAPLGVDGTDRDLTSPNAAPRNTETEASPGPAVTSPAADAKP